MSELGTGSGEAAHRPTVGVLDVGRPKYWGDLDHLPDAGAWSLPGDRRCVRAEEVTTEVSE